MLAEGGKGGESECSHSCRENKAMKSLQIYSVLRSLRSSEGRASEVSGASKAGQKNLRQKRETPAAKLR